MQGVGSFQPSSRKSDCLVVKLMMSRRKWRQRVKPNTCSQCNNIFFMKKRKLGGVHLHPKAPSKDLQKHKDLCAARCKAVAPGQPGVGKPTSRYE